MIEKKVILTKRSIILNFSQEYCKTPQELVGSKPFNKLLGNYLNKIKKNDTEVYRSFSKYYEGKELKSNMILLLKLLIVFDVKEIKGTHKELFALMENHQIFIKFVEGFYAYWRKFERYTIMSNNKVSDSIESKNFISSNNKFTNLILSTYRLIEEKVMGYTHSIYRQLIVGPNLSLEINKTEWNMPKEYEMLGDVNFIQNLVLYPPFILYPKRNKRKGIFNERKTHPLKGKEFNPQEWLCYPAKVGKMLAFVYFHVDFIAQGTSLMNLFELAKPEECENKKPDLIYVFGYEDGSKEMEASYFKDKKNDIYIGYSNNTDEIDYFGYMKKMMLTLQNLKLLEKEQLPVHGAAVNLVLKTGRKINIVIIGDSGAGKSESLEAFRTLAKDYIKDMTIIFDDMGYLTLEKGEMKCYGTEVGAFVRVDDLDKGYPYEQIDRSIFMNPNTDVNARMIIPISTYEEITRGYKVDMVLQANNYEEGKGIEEITELATALEVFTKGTRMAKGTTQEVGLIDSFFSNPFGPVQEKEQTIKLMNLFFSKMFDKEIFVGQIRTRLGLKGQEMTGPRQAGKELFELLKK